MDSNSQDVSGFLQRWRDASGTELANYQMFVQELCDVLGVPTPEPSRADTAENAYVFERRVTLVRGDGGSSEGRIDCYRRGSFVLEAKKVRAPSQTKGFDDALLRARSQAEGYARALPAGEGRPPFLLVVDVGNIVEVYAEFTRSGATYTPYPDPLSHRLRLDDLARPEICEMLRAIWLDPLSLDPTRRSAKVTREIAERLATIAKALEAAQHDPQTVAAFLSRCLFTMFAEDVGLLPKRSFVELLEKYRDKPDVLARQLEILWTNMDRGEFSPVLDRTLPRFNGKLFKERHALPLSREQIDLLIAAARADWKQVEPAIFGTLLERALNPAERHALGAHYTPRAYVERLVLPTIVEPLRTNWSHAQAAALVLAQEGKLKDAAKIVRDFLHTLAHVRVLDPACGSGNFLYVTLEHLKRLEGEVLNQLDALGDTQGRLDLAGVTVDPHQLLGIEINPRAAEIAEMVLWIGYLQWHYRTRGNVMPPEPVLKDFHNIEYRDAVLAYDRMEYETETDGRVVSRWDGQTTKPHPITGLPVPDEDARSPVEKYVNPRAARWPEADFVVGNPPFIGNKRMREVLGDGYVESLRDAWPAVPESADFVMYWWEHAANLLHTGKLRRFGLITTNSVTQAFNRQVLERHLSADQPLSLRFAIPDHPWVDSTNGAAVRIAMTVADAATNESRGELVTVTFEGESPTADDATAVQLERRSGVIQADLRVGAEISRTKDLRSNAQLSHRGVIPHGDGFLLTPSQADLLGLGRLPGLDQHIRPYRNGRDLAAVSRDLMVIDLYGLTNDDVRARFPEVYQWLFTRVKPARDAHRDKDLREKWWLHRRSNEDLRHCLQRLRRYVATGQTAKHRFFVFLDGRILPDDKLIAIGSDDAVTLGILSSRVHVSWALTAGGKLGVGNDPVYNKTTCFERFPFPTCDTEQTSRIRELGEQLDAHRKRQQVKYGTLTLTGIYNVLEKLRAEEPLTAKERTTHDHGIVSVLRELHDELDRAVFDAYRWSDLGTELVGRPGATTPLPDRPPEQVAAEEELLTRLVKLNAERAAEEARGVVRWLRPEFQAKGTEAPAQGQLAAEDVPTAATVTKAKRVPWPSSLPDQIRAVAEAVSRDRQTLDLHQLAAHFTGRGRWKERLPQIVEALEALGRVRVSRHGENIDAIASISAAR